MRKLIAGLLALTALSPMTANAQDTPDRGERWQRGPQAELRADVDGRDDPRPATRDARPDRAERGPRGDGAARFEADAGRDGPDRAGWRERDDDRATRGERRGPDDRTPRPGRQRGPDSDGPIWGDGRPVADGRADTRFERRAPDRARTDRRDRIDRSDRFDRRGDDWAGSRFGDRDDGWTRSRFGDRNGWNRGWRSDSRYDWNRYRATNRNAFHLPRYYAPGGWGGGYRRFQIGVGLQASLWSRNYWIDDPYAYRLPEAYGPYRWVRYYDDALLVDIRTGVIVDAAYGIFW